jgi:type II secretory pathway pseudopilin PulG
MTEKENSPVSTPPEQNVTEHPVVQYVSNYIGIISIVVIVATIIGFIAYLSYESTLNAKMKERRDNALIYDDTAQKSILGAKDLPEIEIGKQRQSAQSQQQQMMMQQQAQQQQMIQQQTQTQQTEPEPSKKPSPTQVPENTFVNSDGTVSFTHPSGWTKNIAGTSVGSTDGEYTARVLSEDSSSTLEDYAKSKPHGRPGSNGGEKTTAGGNDAYRTNAYIFDPGGAPVKAQELYLKSKDGKKIITIQLDAKNLDINNSDAKTVFDSIVSSITLSEAEEN